MSRFTDRACLVTGSTGMAASAARAIAAEGGSVFIASRTPDHARELAEAIGHSAAWYAADLTVEGEVEDMVEACVARFGRIDALYAVVGISGRRFGDGPLHEATLAGWQAVLETNATSLFLVARAVVQRMLAQSPDADGQRGTILTMSSALARHPSAVHFATHAYAASKGAIEGLTAAMAAHYAPNGIRVNAIAPSLTATPMSLRAQADPEILTYLVEKQPLAGGPIDAEAITAVALHLLSRESRMVTGQVLAVDAGWGVSEPAPPPARAD